MPAPPPPVAPRGFNGFTSPPPAPAVTTPPAPLATAQQPATIAPATLPGVLPVSTGGASPTAAQIAAQNPTLANALSTSALLTTPGLTPTTSPAIATPIASPTMASMLSALGGSQIIDNTVLNRLKAGDTAGFINALSGNVQSSLNTSSQLFFQLTG